MRKQLLKVKHFQRTFGAGVADEPTLIDPKTSELRFELMKEENEEYKEAIENDNLVEVADALGDMLYILCGTILEHGMQHIIGDVFDEIHRSNMSKTDAEGKAIINGENGVMDNTRPKGKILKSDTYSKPQLKDIVNTKFTLHGKMQLIQNELDYYNHLNLTNKDENYETIISESRKKLVAVIRQLPGITANPNIE